jgi:hypothetical protein
MIMKHIFIAATLATAFWGLTRWLGRRHGQFAKSTRYPTESWENEGGALARNPADVEAPRVPR